MAESRPGLVILGGPPGTGKTSLARLVSGRTGALVVDDDEGYAAAYQLARLELDFGGPVVADTVNPDNETRAGWLAVAADCGVAFFQVQLACSDPDELRRRGGSWEADTYAAWDADIFIDTSTVSAEQAAALVVAAARQLWGEGEQAR